MASRKVNNSQKSQIIELFKSGRTIKDISKIFNFTIPTITRQLKNMLGIEEFLEIKNKKHESQKTITKEFKNNSKNLIEQNSLAKGNQSNLIVNDTGASNEIDSFPEDKTSNSHSFFVELPPINAEIECSPQKDLSSIHISEIDFPKIVYMIVDKKIELETKILKDYPEWQFMSETELMRKTIKIYFDQSSAKKECNKDQKVIKVPNTNVFSIVAPILVARGISRIVSENQLIAL